MFGEWIKKKRIKNKLSLREFCRLVGEDPSNWSKVERNLLTPPQNELKLVKIAAALKIDLKSEEFKDFQTMAAVSAGRIPEYLMNEREILQSLPAFLRTIGSVKPTPDELNQIIATIKKERI